MSFFPRSHHPPSISKNTRNATGRAVSGAFILFQQPTRGTANEYWMTNKFCVAQKETYPPGPGQPTWRPPAALVQSSFFFLRNGGPPTPACSLFGGMGARESLHFVPCWAVVCLFVCCCYGVPLAQISIELHAETCMHATWVSVAGFVGSSAKVTN
jgi:hypothetical protein